MKNPTEWMALADEDWDFDLYGEYLLVSPDDDIELMVDDLNDMLTGRHLLVCEQMHGADGASLARLRVEGGAARELPLAGDSGDVYRVLGEAVAALQDDTVFFMDINDMGTDMHSFLALPRNEAEAMQARYPEKVAARLLRLQPGDDLWSQVREWMAGTFALPDPAKEARQVELQAAQAQLQQAMRKFRSGGMGDKFRLVGKLFNALRRKPYLFDANWQSDPRAVHELAEDLQRAAPHPAAAAPVAPASPARKTTIATVVRAAPWWKFWA